MNSIRIILVCVAIVLGLLSAPTAQEWRGLRPLHSTCKDVKRILRVTTCEPPDNIYDLGDERVRIIFSKSPCEKAWQKQWNTPPGTVMSIERFLRKRIPIADFHIDESKYKKIFTDFTDEVIYVSEEEGMSFSVINEEVYIIE
jgi:hypothetical protein